MVSGIQPVASDTPMQVMVYTEDWPPLNFMDSNGEISGHSTVQVKALMDATGISYDLQLVSWYRAYHLTLKTPNTLLYTILRTPEREDLFHWYCPISTPQQISLFRLTAGKVITLNKLEDAKSLILGVIRGDYPSEYLFSQGFEENKNLIFSTNEEANVRLLLSGRLDLLVQAEPALHSRLEQMGLPADTVTKTLNNINGDSLEACLVINKESDPKLIALLDSTFSQLKSKK